LRWRWRRISRSAAAASESCSTTRQRRNLDTAGYATISGAGNLVTVETHRLTRVTLLITPLSSLMAQMSGKGGFITALDQSGGSTPGALRLSANHGMIPSFSRALVEDLRHSMSYGVFNAALAKSVDEIYQASTMKV